MSKYYYEKLCLETFVFIKSKKKTVKKILFLYFESLKFLKVWIRGGKLKWGA